MERITELQQLKADYVARKKEKLPRETLQELKAQIKATKKRYKEEWRQFRKLSKQIYRFAPI